MDLELRLGLASCSFPAFSSEEISSPLKPLPSGQPLPVIQPAHEHARPLPPDAPRLKTVGAVGPISRPEARAVGPRKAEHLSLLASEQLSPERRSCVEDKRLGDGRQGMTNVNKEDAGLLPNWTNETHVRSSGGRDGLDLKDGDSGLGEGCEAGVLQGCSQGLVCRDMLGAQRHPPRAVLVTDQDKALAVTLAGRGGQGILAVGEHCSKTNDSDREGWGQHENAFNPGLMDGQGTQSFPQRGTVSMGLVQIPWAEAQIPANLNSLQACNNVPLAKGRGMAERLEGSLLLGGMGSLQHAVSPQSEESVGESPVRKQVKAQRSKSRSRGVNPGSASIAKASKEKKEQVMGACQDSAGRAEHETGLYAVQSSDSLQLTLGHRGGRHVASQHWLPLALHTGPGAQGSGSEQEHVLRGEPLLLRPWREPAHATPMVPMHNISQAEGANPLGPVPHMEAANTGARGVQNAASAGLGNADGSNLKTHVANEGDAVAGNLSIPSQTEIGKGVPVKPGCSQVELDCARSLFELAQPGDNGEGIQSQPKLLQAECRQVAACAPNEAKENALLAGACPRLLSPTSFSLSLSSRKELPPLTEAGPQAEVSAWGAATQGALLAGTGASLQSGALPIQGEEHWKQGVVAVRGEDSPSPSVHFDGVLAQQDGSALAPPGWNKPLPQALPIRKRSVHHMLSATDNSENPGHSSPQGSSSLRDAPHGLRGRRGGRGRGRTRGRGRGLSGLSGASIAAVESHEQQPHQQVTAGPQGSSTKALTDGTPSLALQPHRAVSPLEGSPGPGARAGTGSLGRNSSQGARQLGNQGAVYRKGSIHRFGSDGHMWHKYSHKRLRNSLLERSYFSCVEKDVTGCQARKLVDRPHDTDTAEHDIVTFEGEHNHTPMRVFEREEGMVSPGQGAKEADQW